MTVVRVANSNKRMEGVQADMDFYTIRLGAGLLFPLMALSEHLMAKAIQVYCSQQ